VVILNWNGADFLRKFLPPLIEFTDTSIADIWVADNGSGDSSLDILAGEFPTVKCISFGQNHGFAGGYNLALEQIEASYFVLLNSDVEVSQGWLEPMYKMLSDDPGTGACMPKIMSLHQRDHFEHAGAAGGFLDRFGYPFCRGRIFNRLEKDEGQYDVDSNIFWASGACLMIRSDLYRRSGGLDTFFFAHMEEIDLCWRIKNMGHAVKYCHASKVYHIGGGTLSKKDHKKTYLNFRNNIILLYKNLPRRRLIPVMLPRFVLDFISIFQFLFRFEFNNMISVIRAHLFLLGNLRSVRRLRRENRQIAPPALHQEVYRGSIVYNFFLRGKKHFSDLHMEV